MKTSDYLSGFDNIFPSLSHETPWHIVRDLTQHLVDLISTLGSDYEIRNDIAIHRSAVVEQHVVFKGPIIISAGCFVGANAYLRGGVFCADKVSIGPGCEVKTSIIMNNSSLAHFNFAGDSLIGAFVNMEAGSILANHHNDRGDKTIYLKGKNGIIKTDVIKFGSIIGDHTKIGANAVCSPGTVLEPHSLVKRLELI